jgi:hypothetical protein
VTEPAATELPKLVPLNVTDVPPEEGPFLGVKSVMMGF